MAPQSAARRDLVGSGSGMIGAGSGGLSGGGSGIVVMIGDLPAMGLTYF